MCKRTKAKERKIRNLSYVKCIKNDDKIVLMWNEEISNRWKECLSKLLNEAHASKIHLGENFSWREKLHNFHRTIIAKKVN